LQAQDLYHLTTQALAELDITDIGLVS
jgi:hypothetical protein